MKLAEVSDAITCSNDCNDEVNNFGRFHFNPGSNCSLPSIDDFPTDLFDQDQRISGAVVIHILVSMYIFLALAIICDDYFVSAMDRICEGI